MKIEIVSRKYFSRVSRGFTLLEVMIVISIISILAGFLIPKFIGYENKAKTVKAINTGKQIYNAVMCTYSDSGSSMDEVDEDAIESSISELTGLNLDDSAVDVNSTTVVIDYTSDGKDYTVSVTPSDGSYTVNDGKTNVFTQN